VDQAAFLDGKTITLIVPYNPGGGFDSFVRLLAPELEKQLDGVKVTVENQPGGGGLIGANGIYQSEPDGLTLGLINYPGAVFAEASQTEGVTFKNSEWTLLTRLGAINPIVYTGADTGMTTFEDIMASTDPVMFGIGGVGSDAYYATVVMSEVLGFPVEIIAGYPGGAEADAALIVGEVQAGVNSVDAALTRIDGSGANITALISTEPNELAPGVPLITEFGDDEQKEILTALASIYDLERIMVGPPGMDEALADFLADAIFRAASSAGYTKAMEAAGLTPAPLERNKAVERAETVHNSIDKLTPYIQK
jgi:tripartite-type tricarboxylate transporter receptor subunit TctC